MAPKNTEQIAPNGPQVVLARKRAGYANQRACEHAGLTQSVLSRMESGKPVSPRSLMLAAQLFGVDPRDLVLGTDGDAFPSIESSIKHVDLGAACLDTIGSKFWSTDASHGRVHAHLVNPTTFTGIRPTHVQVWPYKEEYALADEQPINSATLGDIREKWLCHLDESVDITDSLAERLQRLEALPRQNFRSRTGTPKDIAERLLAERKASEILLSVLDDQLTLHHAVVKLWAEVPKKFPDEPWESAWMRVDLPLYIVTSKQSLMTIVEYKKSTGLDHQDLYDFVQFASEADHRGAEQDSNPEVIKDIRQLIEEFAPSKIEELKDLEKHFYT